MITFLHLLFNDIDIGYAKSTKREGGTLIQKPTS